MKTKILLFICLLPTLVACKKNNPEPVPEPAGNALSCTMAIYGSGGSNKDNGVDVDYVNELISAMKFGPTEKIKVIAQYNFDSNDPGLPYVNGTAVMRLLEKNDKIEEIDADSLDYSKCKTVLDSNEVRSVAINEKLEEMVKSGAFSFEKLNGSNKARLYLPSEIAKFLDRAAKECPADHYHFCVSGHGGGWDAGDDKERTKAVAYDNNAPDSTGISAKNFTAGVNASSIAAKIPVVYFNACQMNFLENICEYAACPVTYAMVSFKYTNGTVNSIVLSELAAAEGNEVSDLLDALIAAYKDIFKEKSCDISFVDIKSMKSAAEGVKDLVPLLKNDYKDDPKWYNAEIRGLGCPDDKSVSCDKDFSEFLADLANEENIDSTIKATASSIRSDIQASIVKTIYGDSCSVKKNLLCGVKFIGKEVYAESRENHAASYDNNAFYSLTKWNTLFELFDDKINQK